MKKYGFHTIAGYENARIDEFWVSYLCLMLGNFTRISYIRNEILTGNRKTIGQVFCLPCLLLITLSVAFYKTTIWLSKYSSFFFGD